VKKISKKQMAFISLTSSFLILIIGSNYAWYRVLKREQEKLTHAIIPTLTDDYYLNQVALTKHAQKNQERRGIEIDSETNEPNLTISPQDVPLVSQNPDYPNGCEAASATMLLNYYKIPITLPDFIENYLMKETVYEKNGIRYGPNPASFYAEDPKDPLRGWGCFEPVIASAIQKVINDYKKEENQHIDTVIIRNEQKYSLSQNLVQNMPMIIWTTINYEEVKEVYEWLSYDAKSTYTYPKNSHAVVVTGVDENYYYINDPLKGQKNIPIEKEQLEKSFDSMGRQVIGLYFYDFSNDIEEK